MKHYNLYLGLVSGKPI